MPPVRLYNVASIQCIYYTERWQHEKRAELVRLTTHEKFTLTHAV